MKKSHRDQPGSIAMQSGTRNTIKWGILVVVLVAIFAISMMKPPEDVAKSVVRISTDWKLFSAFVHIFLLGILLAGFLFKEYSNVLLFIFVAFLALSATVTSIVYFIPPNFLAFSTIFVLLITSYLEGGLNFSIKSVAPPDKSFGILGVVFGFWYLHWVEAPIWLNALLYSPLGSANCPTLLTICGFLCLSTKPRPVMLELTTALITLYFGIFGIIFLEAYVDIVLVVCSMFLIIRSGGPAVLPNKRSQGAL